MPRTAALVALFTAFPMASAVFASQTVQEEARSTGEAPDLQQPAISTNAGRQSLPGLTSAADSVADVTEEAGKKPGHLARTGPSEELDSGDWLAVLAMAIALSAYMAALRWTLIGKYGEATTRIESTKASLRRAARRRAKLEAERTQNLDQARLRRGSLSDFLRVALLGISIPKRGETTSRIASIDASLKNETWIEKNLEKEKKRLKKDLRKYQLGIRLISIADFLLVVAAALIFWHLFAYYMGPVRWSLIGVAVWAFGLAGFVFIALHALEWRKVIQKITKK